MKTSKFEEVFRSRKPVIGMLHLRGESPSEVVDIARSETEIMYGAGVAAVLVENYFGDRIDVENTLRMLQKEFPNRVYGVNVLGSFTKSYDLALAYGAKFMQVDSICGHLDPEEEPAFEEMIAENRKKGDLFVLGGVRFKYQPVLSRRPLPADLRHGRRLCDAIVVTGDATGLDTGMGKIREFRRLLGDFPLIVGAGLTAETCAEQLSVADGGIVGTYFKEDGVTKRPIDPMRVARFMEAAYGVGANAPGVIGHQEDAREA